MNTDSNEAVHRILDASANRVGEGLRTVEEWARFGFNDADLASQWKSIRHEVTEALKVVPRSSLLVARDTPGDVGTAITMSQEYDRQSARDVVVAGIARTGQSLRVLEEYLKTIDSTAAAKIEQSRYRFYTAAAELELRMARLEIGQRLDRATLYVLIDAGSDEKDFLKTVRVLCDSGVDIVQLRDKTQSDRTLIDRAGKGTSVANQHGALFIMNDRADLAFASGCDGVHVGQNELPLAIARKIVGPERIVGVSTHSIDQANQAVSEGADYIGCGPVFPSRTKSFQEFSGLDYVRQVAGKIRIPSFAIGGIDRDNVDQVIEAGATRIAVTSAIKESGDPAHAVRRLKEML